jgi:transposase
VPDGRGGPRPGRPSKGDEAPEATRGLAAGARAIKGSRFALVRGKENLTDAQMAKLGELRKAGSHLFKAWELKEDLRAVLQAESAEEAEKLLGDWLHRAACCRMAKVVEAEKKVRRRRDDIVRAVELGISNARVEAVNNKIKVTVRMGYGFRNTDNLTALLMLKCSDVQPSLPGRPSRKLRDAA